MAKALLHKLFSFTTAPMHDWKIYGARKENSDIEIKVTPQHFEPIVFDRVLRFDDGMIKENTLSFDDKKKATIVIIDAIINLMTTKQRDDEDLTDYTKHFQAVRDLCKEEYGGIFEIPTLTQKEFTWTSDKEGSYKTAYASFLSILYLKNIDQTKYGSFNKKMAEDFATGQENVYLTHIEDVQHILSIHKYDQAYHNKWKKQ